MEVFSAIFRPHFTREYVSRGPYLAQMAELVDALGSGPSGGNTVEVRVLFWAPNTKGRESGFFVSQSLRVRRAKKTILGKIATKDPHKTTLSD
jgi:hypothetical protein